MRLKTGPERPGRSPLHLCSSSGCGTGSRITCSHLLPLFPSLYSAPSFLSLCSNQSSPSLLPSSGFTTLNCLEASFHRKNQTAAFPADLHPHSLKHWEEVTFIHLLQGRKRGVCIYIIVARPTIGSLCRIHATQIVCTRPTTAACRCPEPNCQSLLSLPHFQQMLTHTGFPKGPVRGVKSH